MEVDLAVLADAATIDGAGKLNILGIFDRIGAASFPARHPRIALVLRFAAGLQEAGRHDVGISLQDAAGQEMMRIDGEMQLGAGPGSAARGIQVPHVLNLDGLVFPKPGRYSFEVRVDGEHHVSISLSVDGPEASARA